MKKVVTINLNRRAYQVDEDAFELLRAYLERAGQALRDNPDRDEILADLEQAIAEKCDRWLGPQKSVVSAADVRQLLDEMGPVDAGTAGPASEASDPAGTGPDESPRPRPAAAAPKRLYRIMEGAWLGGVCTGVGAYLNVDPTIVRVIWGVLGLLDLSVMKIPVFTLGYLAVWSLIPEASTSEERAAASGAAFNAHEIVQEAKRHYAEFRTGHFTRSARRQKRREFRQRMRHAWNGAPFWAAPPSTPLGYGARLSVGAFAPFLTFAAVLMFWLMAFAVLSLADTRTILHWTLPPDVPLWVGLLGLMFVYHWLVWPLRLARRAGYYAMSGGHPGWIEAWDAVAGLAFTALILWFAYTRVPGVRELTEHLPDLWRRLTEWLETLRR